MQQYWFRLEKKIFTGTKDDEAQEFFTVGGQV